VIQGTIIAQASGKTLTVRGSTVVNAGIIQSGNGAALNISGTFTNSGLISPQGGGSAGTIAVFGNFVQTPAGTLRIDIGGLTAGTQFDRVSISGTATLAGTVAVKLINGFVPAVGSTFQFLAFASRTGTFATIQDLDPGDGTALGAVYSAGNVTLTAAAGAALPTSVASAVDVLAPAVKSGSSPTVQVVSKQGLAFSSQPIVQRRPKRRVAVWF
jgi:adhesin HecA-like repeat protein